MLSLVDSERSMAGGLACLPGLVDEPSVAQ
jgi:hypothetical protein